MSLADILPKFVTDQWNRWTKKMEDALVYFAPIYVAKHNSLFSPLIAVVALIMAIVMAGIAFGSFFTLLASLLVLYFILTRVFGIRLDMGDVFVV